MILEWFVKSSRLTKLKFSASLHDYGISNDLYNCMNRMMQLRSPIPAYKNVKRRSVKYVALSPTYM